MRKLIITLLLICNHQAYAFEAALANLEQEQRAKKLFSLIKCAKCKGQSIKDSDAEIAILIRQNIRRQIEADRTNQEILNFLETRYGEEINMSPKFNNRNIFLWLLPLFFIIGGICLILKRAKLNESSN